MEAHLSSGCGECRRAAELFGKLAAIADRETEYEPPAGVLRRARAIFPQSRTRPTEKSAPILARLIYDSFRDPLPAGMRAQDRPSQALFEAGDFSLDLHLNREREGGEHGVPWMVLVGQIADRTVPGRRVANLPVVLVSETGVAARATSNSLGEFHLEYDPRRRVSLCITVGRGRHIEIPLPQSREGMGAP